jgi:hypothetical protein
VSTVDWKNLDFLTRELVGGVVDDTSVSTSEDGQDTFLLSNGQDTEVRLLNGELVGRLLDRHDVDHLGVSTVDWKNLDVLTRELVGGVVDDSSITAGEGAVVVDQPSVTTGK